MELCDDSPVLRHRLFDQSVHLSIYPSNKKDWLVEVGLVHVDDRPGDYDCHAGDNFIYSMQPYKFLLGPKDWDMLETDHIRRRGMGSSWYGHCYQLHVPEINIAQAYAIFSDLTCSLLPAVVLWKIKIDIRLKIGVCCLMSLGLMYISHHLCILHAG